MNHQQFVCYGDEICLSELAVGGVVAGDADITKTVFLDREVNFEASRTVHNQAVCQFIVRPKFQYAASKAFRKKLQRSVAKINASNWFLRLDHGDPLYHDLVRDKKQIEDERETNDMEARRASGRHVAYGSVIQLMHSHSAHFLTQTKNRAAHDRMSMEVVLTEEGDEGSWWRVMPAEKVRSAGEWVRHRDKVVLVSVKFQDSFLHVASEGAPMYSSNASESQADDNTDEPLVMRRSSSLDENLDGQQLAETVGRILLHSTTNARFELNAFPSGTSRFQISVFRQHVRVPAGSRAAHRRAQKYIAGSDVCTLYRRENNSFLVGDGEDGSVQWVPSNGHGLTGALWRVKRGEIESGGSKLLRNQSGLVIQHLSSGLYLGLGEEELKTASRRSSTEPVLLATKLRLKSEPPASSWMIQAFTDAADDGDVGLVDREVVWVELEGAAGSHAHQKGVRRCLSTTAAPTNASDRGPRTSEVRPAVLAAVHVLENMEAIEIGRAPQEDVDQVAFIGWTRPILEGIREQMTIIPPMPAASLEADSLFGIGGRAEVEVLAKHVLPVAERCLGAMIRSCTKSNEVDPMRRDGPPIKASQDRLRGTGVMKLVLDLMVVCVNKFPKPASLDPNVMKESYYLVSKLKVEFPEMWKFCSLCFRLLLRCCTKNPANQQMVLPFNMHFKRPDLMDLGVFELLQESLANSLNHILKLDLSKLSTAIEALLAIPSGAMRALRTLVAISENDGIPILRNQNLCLSFLESSQHLIPVVQVMESGDVVLSDPGTEADSVLLSDSSVSLKELHRKHQDLHNAQDDLLASSAMPAKSCAALVGERKSHLFQFYLGLLDCICVVTKGRNSRAHHFFKTHAERFGVGYAHLLRAIGDEELPSSYKLRCCRLIEQLYVDTDPHTEVQAESLTHIWPRALRAADIKDDTLLHAFEYLDSNPLADLKAVLLQLVERYQRMNVEEMEKNRFIRSLVHLISALLRFGFYHSKDRDSRDVFADNDTINTIAMPLARILDGRDDFCAPVGALSGDVARFEQADKTAVVMELRLETLSLIRDLFLCTNGLRQKQFIHLWEKMMDARMGISGWKSACASARMCDSGGQGVDHASASAHPSQDAPGPSHAVSRFNDVRASKVAPEPVASLRDYIDGVKYWKTSAPWTKKDLAEMREHLLTPQFVHENPFPETLGIVANPAELPPFFKVVLDLVRYKHAGLKEQAILAVLGLFNVSLGVMDLLRQTQIVCDPLAAELFVRLKGHAIQMRRSIVLLQSSDGDYLTQVEQTSVNTILTRSIQSRRVSDAAHDQSRRDMAFRTCFDILEEWTGLCTDGPKAEFDPKQVRTMLYNIGVHHIVASILRLPCEKSQPNGPGTLLVITDARIRELFGAVNDFVASLVVDNQPLQNVFLEMGNLQEMQKHVHVEGLRVTHVVSSLFKNNEAALQSKSKEYILLMLELITMYERPKVSWLALVSDLSTTRENQGCAFNCLGRDKGRLRHILAFVSKWDELVDLMAVENGTGVEADSNPALVLAALFDILSAGCSGKAPAAEVFAASLVSWNTAIRMVIGTKIKTDGSLVELPPSTEYRFKECCLRFVHKVYIETGVKRLLEEVVAPQNAIFSLPASDPRFLGCETLMTCLQRDVNALTDGIAALSDAHVDELLHARFTYIYGAVFPMLSDLFLRPLSHFTTEVDGAAMCEALFDSIVKLLEVQLPSSLRRIDLMGKKRDAQKQAWLALQRMSVQGRVRPEWFRHPRNQVYTPTEHKAEGVNERRVVEKALQRSALEMLNTMMLEIGHSTTAQAVPRGMCNLALILNQTSEAPLYDPEVFRDLGLSVPSNPPYYEIMMAILDVTREAATNEDVLVKVLQLVRCSLYVCEPTRLDEPQKLEPKEVEKSWRLFLEKKAIVKISEPPDANLDWLQERFDMMGATVMALRLVSHRSARVREESVLLLLGLLQEGNPKVQNTIAVFLSQSRGKAVFKAIMDILDTGAEALKDFKRTIKLVKRTIDKGGNTNRTLSLTSRGEREVLNLSGSEAVSLHTLTLTLRLLQLFCEGQYRPLQQLVHRQPGLPNHDLLERCLDLFEIVHPLLVDAMHLNDGELVVFTLQLLETISEMVQGPEQTNQEAVISSNFLACCNRVLSQIVYAPVEETKAINMDCSTNDLRSWLKSDLVGCILALLESCNDAEVPKRMLEFFELRNVTNQMVSVGRILGFCDVQEAVHVNEDEDELSGFGGGGGSMLHSASLSWRRTSSATPTSHHAHARSFHRSPLLLHLHQLSLMRDTHQLHLVEAMHFSEGYQETLEKELSSLYFLLQILEEFDNAGHVHEQVNTFRLDQPVLMAKLSSECFEVELVRRHGRTQQPQAERVYFRVNRDILDVVSNAHFSKQMGEKMFDVPRGNPVEKARAILGHLKVEIHRIAWLSYVAETWRYRRFILRFREHFEAIPLHLSVLITALLLLVYGIPVDPHSGDALAGGSFWGFEVHAPGYHAFDSPYPWANLTSDPTGFGATYSGVVWSTDLSLKFRLTLKTRWDSMPEWEFWAPARPIAMALALLHVMFSTINIIAHMAHEFPLATQSALEEHAKTVGADEKPATVRKARETVDAIQPMQHGRKALKNMRPRPVPKKITLGFRFWMLLVRRSPIFIYFYFMAVVSWLGFLRSPFFHVMYMLDFFRRPAGRLVRQSLVHGGPNLLRSFLLGCVVLVCFGFFSYEFFSPVVNEEQQVCRTPWQCISKHVMDSMTGDLTTVLGNDLGVFSFPAMVMWADSWQSFRTFFVFCSLIFWVFLLQGIIQGQIIDAFAEMRNNAEAMAADLEQKCFVSSVDRFVFNSFPGEWEKRRGGKYIFNYLFYFVTLLRKDPEELNGLENVVLKKFHEDDVEFFPIETFVARERALGGEAKKEDLHEAVHNLSSDMQRVERDMHAGMKAMQQSVDAILQRLEQAPDVSRRSSTEPEALRGAPTSPVRAVASAHLSPARAEPAQGPGPSLQDRGGA